MQGGKVFADQVGYHITDLITTSFNYADIFRIQGMGNGELGSAPITVGREVRGLDEVV